MKALTLLVCVCALVGLIAPLPAAGKLAANKLAANKLAANSLSSTRLEALSETAAILSTADGREVYAYMVSCALAEGTEIEAHDVYECVDTDNDPDTACVMQRANDPYCIDGTCTFQGALGLADHWRDKKLTKEGQGWVSACLFARVNLFVTAEGISLRGEHPGLTIGNAERSNFTLQEGAFWGNVFRNTKDDSIDWNACMGTDQALVSPDPDTGGGINLRDCTEPSPDDPSITNCGFHYAGECAGLIDQPQNGKKPKKAKLVCEDVDPIDGFYMGCLGSAGGRAQQVITVYVGN
jgi:hypothetical protein